MSEAPGKSLASVVLRLVVVLAFVLLATWVSHMVRDALNLEVVPQNEQRVHRAIMLRSVVYVAGRMTFWRSRFLIRQSFQRNATVSASALTRRLFEMATRWV